MLGGLVIMASPRSRQERSEKGKKEVVEAWRSFLHTISEAWPVLTAHRPEVAHSPPPPPEGSAAHPCIARQLDFFYTLSRFFLPSASLTVLLKTWVGPLELRVTTRHMAKVTQQLAQGGF